MCIVYSVLYMTLSAQPIPIRVSIPRPADLLSWIIIIVIAIPRSLIIWTFEQQLPIQSAVTVPAIIQSVSPPLVQAQAQVHAPDQY